MQITQTVTLTPGAHQRTGHRLISSSVSTTTETPSKGEWIDKYQYTGYEIKWINVFIIVVAHIGALAGLWRALFYARLYSWIWGIFVLFLGGLGVTGGAHRMWTHRSYKAKLPLRIILMIFYSVAGQNPLYEWVRDHRVHHKFSETDADPHNVKRGFFFAHMGWLMKRKHPEVRRRGQEMDMSDILADPVVRFHGKWFVPMQLTFAFVLPAAVAMLCWNENFWTAFLGVGLFRQTFGLHSTWLVNSAAHMFGNKPYDRRIAPAENSWVSFFALGEGWHNYHHVFPWDYKAAELGYLNWTMHVLNWFGRLGLAYDFKKASPELIDRVVERHGDGSRNLSEHMPEIPEEAAQNPEIVDSLFTESANEIASTPSQRFADRSYANGSCSLKYTRRS